MRRITYWLMSTVSALVLLFSYPTSTNAKAKTSVQTLDQSAASSGSDSGAGSSSASGSGTDSASGDTGSSSSGSDSSGSSGSSSSSTTDSGSSSSSTTDSGSSSSGTKTYAGDSVMTRWGIVQVQITVKNGTITKSEVLQVPWDNPRDQEINSYAVPILNKEVVAAQSASIDMISGATVTSDGYIQSLQSAIDQAHLS